MDSLGIISFKTLKETGCSQLGFHLHHPDWPAKPSTAQDMFFLLGTPPKTLCA